MKLILVRAFQDWTVTMGMLKLEGVRHDPIFTLENPLRETSKDSLIPAGLYRLKPYTSPRWPDVYEIVNVPGRTHILLHWGNTEKDTTGCVIVGRSAGVLGKQPAVLQSIHAMDMVRKLIGRVECDIEIIGFDRGTRG